MTEVYQKAKRIYTCVRWFVDEHGVHGHDVGSGETLHILQDLRNKHSK